jgi:hypothetical protein
MVSSLLLIGLDARLKASPTVRELFRSRVAASSGSSSRMRGARTPGFLKLGYVKYPVLNGRVDSNLGNAGTHDMDFESDGESPCWTWCNSKPAR